MPTYDYRCTSCEHEFEAFQSMSAKPLKKCPECDKKALERLIGTGAGLIFKGSGFYETDYRSESYKKAQEAETKGSSNDGGGGNNGGKDGGKDGAKTGGGAESGASKGSGEAGPKKADSAGGSGKGSAGGGPSGKPKKG